MGKAALDLPDPVEQAALKQDVSPDDLLSQMAGQEIERLLSEAESARTKDATGAAPSPSPSPEAPQATPAPPVPSDSTPAAAEKKAPAPSSDQAFPDLQSQLDDLFTKLNTSFEDPSPEAIAQADAAPRPQPAPPAASPAPAGDEDPNAIAASAAAAVAAELEENERTSFAAPLKAALAEEPAEEAEADRQDDRLPFYLRPLEWLNAPLSAAPEATRQAMGKIALVTLLNAVAILLYVLLFRKSH